jgi:hypothetical protein
MVVRRFWLDRVEAAWRRRSVVWLVGVRRVGKTVLCRSLPDVIQSTTRSPSHACRDPCCGSSSANVPFRMPMPGGAGARRATYPLTFKVRDGSRVSGETRSTSSNNPVPVS